MQMPHDAEMEPPVAREGVVDHASAEGPVVMPKLTAMDVPPMMVPIIRSGFR
jgi:hypothetical protein